MEADVTYAGPKPQVALRGCCLRMWNSVFELEVPVVTGIKTCRMWHPTLASGTADCFGCSECHLASATRELIYF